MRRQITAPLVLTALCAFVRVVGGCWVDGLDVTGKRCPCVGGFVCDVATNTCVQDAGVPPANLVDAGMTDAPAGGFVIAQLGATWRTSKSARWDWEVSGNAQDFAEYRLIIGRSEDAVIRQDSTTTLFDSRINPELGSYAGRDVYDGGTAKVWTVTDRLTPGRRFFAKVVVRDKAGRENSSAVVSTETLAETSSVVLFTDQVPDGSAPTPSGLKRVTNDCFSTPGCLEIAKVDCGDASTCRLAIGLASIDGKNVNAMKADQFGSAFVELAVRGGAEARATPYDDLVLTIGAPACRIGGERCRFRFDSGWSFRPGAKEYRLIQVPLGVLRLETPTGPGPSLRYEDLVANGHRIDGIGIEGDWKSGANIGLDHAHIRW